ncbi:efflux RND transporter periplasmic adaptor subunit [Aliikangiella coralliicola]|uniref:efflux RND transporter periplasmic adaptor subunit n=1 Tax=Aliikangiella coralliicola TaxID=2592383 RepID=UPI00143D1B83|nr:HlyD family efflux transporter periplasmic adaptor subunit [Aliikangiella coralliicola]
MDKPLDNKLLKQRRLLTTIKILTVATIVTVLFFVLIGSFTTSLRRDEIRTAKVISGNLKTSLSASGLIVPLYEETIASSIDSRIDKVLVQAGQSVKQGQTLLQLDNTKITLELDNMDEEIALKQNQIDTRNLNLVRSLNDFKSQQELLFVDLDSRQTRFARMQQLALSGGTSKHDLKEAELNVKRTQIEIRQLKQAIKDSKASTLAEIEGLKLEKSILEKSRQEKLRLLESANVKAPRDGLVVWLKNEEGSAVVNGESLIRIADTSAYKLEVSISDFYSSQLWQGMSAEFDQEQTHYSGKVESIIAAEQEGVLKLIVLLDESTQKNQTLLRQKQRVDVNLITGEIENTLMLAKGPFINGAGIQKVFVINDRQAVAKEISVGSSNRDYYQIKQGLSKDDEIIISDVRSYAHLKQLEIN